LVVTSSVGRANEISGLKRFLFANVYRHPRVMKVVAGAEAVVADLFVRYLRQPHYMPDDWRRLVEASTAPEASWQAAAEAGGSERERAAVVADFVAGMTDRFAISEHRRLFDATPELR
jgi:dGTPase